MHHKNKRTPAKENKRYGHKSARARANAAIKGGRPGQARGMSWSNTIPQPPIIDEVGAHKKMTKKTSPKKEKCPVNGKHEWYREWQTIEKVSISARPGYWSCQVCTRLNRELGWPYRYCDEHRIETPYEEYVRTDTCIHCWKVKVLKTDTYQWRLPARRRPFIPRTAYRKK